MFLGLQPTIYFLPRNDDLVSDYKMND